jgi:hypothetical protein
MDVNDKLTEIATKHHRLVDRKDVAKVMSSGQWCRRLDAGDWSAVAPGVWCPRGTPVDWRLQARAGLRSLGGVAALYGPTAAAWWKLTAIVVADVEFVVPRARRSRKFPFVVHQIDRWERRDFMMHDGVRLTNATRTLIDLAAGSLTAAQLENAIDDAVRRRLTSLPTLSRRIGELVGSGRVGSPILRALLLDTGGDSYLERRFLGLVRKAGLPRPTCQVVHRSGAKRIARVDFQFADTNVIVEVSGRLGHVSDRDRQRDARRRNALQQSGHVVLEFTTADVLDEKEYVVTTLLDQIPVRPTC